MVLKKKMGMRFIGWMSFASLLLTGCKITPDINKLVEHMVVQTTYDENTDFGFYKTFTLSLDTLGLYANWTNDTLVVSDPDYDYPTIVTAKIKNEMAAAGYTYKLKDQNPDLGFAVTIFDSYNVYQQLNYPTYYSGYYGFGYGGYYGPMVTTYESSSTTLVIHLIDLKNRDAEGRLKVIWKAYIGDIAQSNDQRGKILEAIQQAFEQSAYLKARP